MNPKEFKEGKQLKAAHACSLIENIFKEKVILQQINCKTWQWKAAFFQTCFCSYCCSLRQLGYDTKVLRH